MAEKDLQEYREPMMRINHSGYQVKVATLLQIAVFVFAGGGAFGLVKYQLNNLETKLVVTPASVQKSVDDMNKVIQSQLNDLKLQAEVARKERTADIKELERRVAHNETENARIGQQVSNLERLIEDVRDLLRRAEAVEGKPKGIRG